MKGGGRAVFGGLDDDEGDDVFEVAHSNHLDKRSANFNQEIPGIKSVEKVALADFEVNTFGRAREEVSKSRYESSIPSPVQSENYISFKHNAKYNKYVHTEAKKPVQTDNGVDRRAKEILKNDDLGEVGEWAGKTLNQNRKKDDSEIDSEEEAIENRKKQQEDDEFDFMLGAPKDKISPQTQSTGGTVPSVVDNQDALRQKIQMKLEGKGLMMGGGSGAGVFSNKLVNKQKELQEKRSPPMEFEVSKPASTTQKAISPPIPQIDHGFQSPKSEPKEKRAKDEVMVHGALRLDHSTPAQAPTVNFRMQGRQLSLGPQNEFEDEWDEVNKIADTKLPDPKYK